MKNYKNTSPSFARCLLNVRAITRKPSAFRFYLRGVLREFDNLCGAVIVCGFALVLFCLGVNIFFQNL
jgi:hypothetical protein